MTRKITRAPMLRWSTHASRWELIAPSSGKTERSRRSRYRGACPGVASQRHMRAIIGMCPRRAHTRTRRAREMHPFPRPPVLDREHDLGAGRLQLGDGFVEVRHQESGDGVREVRVVRAGRSEDLNRCAIGKLEHAEIGRGRVDVQAESTSLKYANVAAYCVVRVPTHQSQRFHGCPLLPRGGSRSTRWRRRRRIVGRLWLHRRQRIVRRTPAQPRPRPPRAARRGRAG
jgi:hypothetical protein